MKTGTNLGPYKILSPLGKGGMGEVYRAKDTRLGREVAIKVLPERLSGDASALARFEREAKVLAALSHPNILTIFDVGSETGISFVVMELLPGETLHRRIMQRRPQWPQAVQMGIEIAEGLSVAHSKGIIHGDLKPENIFLTADDRVKILDFGLARWHHDVNSAEAEFKTAAELPTVTGIVMGTIPYMSPEQLKGVHVDPRSDIFSLGCVLQEMMTGKSPFARSTSAETMSAILKEDPPSLLGFDPVLPMGLDQIVKRCLNKEPDHRFQSAGDLAFHLRQILDSVSLPTTTRQAGRDARRNRMSVKAIAAAIVLLLIGAFAFHRIGMKKVTVDHPQFKSVAVLPLQNFSADPNQEYFVDGMTEALITDLAKIKAIKVISRTSVMLYKNSKQSTREIARVLEADALIEGSVMRSADHVRITVQLIDPSSDQHLWAESYERELKNVFALQGEVAQAIAQQVRAVITPEEQARLVKKRPVDPEVYELYLKGRHIMMRGGLEDVRKAIKYFQSGLAKDPGNALIYTGLADAYIYQMSDVHESPAEATAKSRAAAMKALELDESLAEAHTSLAMIKFSYDWDWTGGEIELKRAIELNPGYLEAYVTYGFYLTIVGRHPEALACFEKAHRLDPIDSWTYRGEGYSDFMAHKYDEAIEQYEKSLEIEPAPMTYFGLVLARAEKGDYATAISEAEKATKLNDSPLLLTSLASAYALAGRRADSNRILRQLEEISKHQGPAPPWHGPPNRYVCPYEVAGVYAQLGDNDQAFEWLDKAYQSRSCMYWLHTDPRLDSLHSDPRFQELLTKMKFPQ
ncbi:MAG TPA: protein kinase [Terriglobia bacterium]|nr:protein kinase [Terriglobia bacterium]